MPVYMRITADSDRTEISVDREFDPFRWNKKANRATGTKEDARTLNAYLHMLQVKVHKVHRDLIDAGEEVTTEKLKNRLRGNDTQKPKILLKIFTVYNQQMLPLIERNGSLFNVRSQPHRHLCHCWPLHYPFENYKNHQRCLCSDLVLPKLTNQKMKEYLK